MSNDIPPYPQGALLQAPLAGESVHEFSGLVVFCQAGVDIALGQLVQRDPDDTSVVRPVPASPAPLWYMGVCIGTREWDLNNYWAAPEAGQMAVIAIPTCMAYVLLQDDLAAGTILTPGTTTAGSVAAWSEDKPYAGILEEPGAAGQRALAYMRPLDPVSIPPGPSGQYGWGLDTLAFVSPQWFYLVGTDWDVAPVDSYTGILSVWFYPTNSFSDSEWILKCSNSVGTVHYTVIGQTNGTLRLQLRNSVPADLVDIQGTVAAAGSNWHHFLASWNLSPGTNYDDHIHLYLDDVDCKPAVPGTHTTGTKVYWGQAAPSNFRAGVGDTVVTVPNVAMSGFYLNMTEYLDLSLESNRRKFISAEGLPQPMGLQGERPTGNQPAMYFDNPVATLLANRGYLGPFQLGTNSVLGDVAGPNP